MKFEKIKERFKGFLVGRYYDFVIIANSERDYRGKMNKIDRGDILGFYKYEE